MNRKDTNHTSLSGDFSHEVATTKYLEMGLVSMQLLLLILNQKKKISGQKKIAAFKLMNLTRCNETYLKSEWLHLEISAHFVREDVICTENRLKKFREFAKTSKITFKRVEK